LKSLQIAAVIHISELWHSLCLTGNRNDKKKGLNTFLIEINKEIIIINELSADFQPH